MISYLHCLTKNENLYYKINDNNNRNGNNINHNNKILTKNDYSFNKLTICIIHRYPSTLV